MKVAAEAGRIEGGATVLHLGVARYIEVPKGGHVELVAFRGDPPCAEFLVESYCSAGVQIGHPLLLREP